MADIAITQAMLEGLSTFSPVNPEAWVVRTQFYFRNLESGVN